MSPRPTQETFIFFTSSLISRRIQTVRNIPTICLLATKQYLCSPRLRRSLCSTTTDGKSCAGEKKKPAGESSAATLSSSSEKRLLPSMTLSQTLNRRSRRGAGAIALPSNLWLLEREWKDRRGKREKEGRREEVSKSAWSSAIGSGMGDGVW